MLNALRVYISSFYVSRLIKWLKCITASCESRNKQYYMHILLHVEGTEQKWNDHQLGFYLQILELNHLVQQTALTCKSTAQWLSFHFTVIFLQFELLFTAKWAVPRDCRVLPNSFHLNGTHNGFIHRLAMELEVGFATGFLHEMV